VTSLEQYWEFLCFERYRQYLEYRRTVSTHLEPLSDYSQPFDLGPGLFSHDKQERQFRSSDTVEENLHSQ
jgi:hypothetical protein